MKQADKVAVVTGGSRGIGAAIARKLASQGAQVVIVYRSNQQQAEHVVADIISQGGKAVAYAADVSQEQDVRDVLSTIATRFGRIDILINNAGVFEGRSLADVDAEHIARVFDGNMGSMLLMTRHALPFFPEHGGRIVNLSSNLILRTAHRHRHLLGQQGSRIGTDPCLCTGTGAVALPSMQWHRP
jgi:3-oxoacyl-[acyl-carrier protein] reductase